jgi:hypothetical protein
MFFPSVAAAACPARTARWKTATPRDTVAAAENSEVDLFRAFAFHSWRDRNHLSLAAQFLFQFLKLLIEICNVKTGMNDKDVGAFSNRLL